MSFFRRLKMPPVPHIAGRKPNESAKDIEDYFRKLRDALAAWDPDVTPIVVGGTVDGALTLTDTDTIDITVTEDGITLDVVDDSITDAKLAPMAANAVKGNPTASTANPSDISVGTNTVLGRVAGNIVAAQLATGQVADDAITYAKIQNVSAASRVLLRGSAGGAGDVQEGTLGAGLSLAGTVLSATASSLLTTKGDLFTHDGTNPVRLPVGASGEHLVVDSSTVTGLRWGAIPLRPAQVTANQNDFAPGSFGTWFINTDASRNFTGISATGAADGLEFLWINNGAFDEVLQNQNAGSAAANRMICAGGGDLTVLPNEMVRIIRDGTAARWRCFLF